MINRIDTEDEYRAALARFVEISDVLEGSAELAEFFQLMILMEKYEQEECS